MALFIHSLSISTSKHTLEKCPLIYAYLKINLCRKEYSNYVGLCNRLTKELLYFNKPQKLKNALVKCNNRMFSQTTVCLIDGLGPSDSYFYNPHRKVPHQRKIKKEFSVKVAIKGLRLLRTEFSKWQEEMYDKFQDDQTFVRPGDTKVLHKFDSEEIMKKWKISTDKSYDIGYSYANLTRSLAGHGLFAGFTDQQVPDDGSTERTGFCHMSTFRAQKSFYRDTYYNWNQYTHIVIRCRGDGRTYTVLLDVSGYFDTSWQNIYTYFLHTRGGPYWQESKIPFSKFAFSGRARLQDKQFKIDKGRICRLGITATGLHGPFRLEIDHISLHNNPSHTEEFAYESYIHPNPLV